MKNKLSYILLALILILSIIPSASALTKSYDNPSQTITIYNGETAIATLRLIENTRYCMTDCHATIEIVPLYDIDTSHLEKFVKSFYNPLNQQTSIKNNWKWYYYADGKALKERNIEKICNSSYWDYNSTAKEIPYNYTCHEKQIYYEDTKFKENKNLGDTLFAGSKYYIGISGKKNPSEIVEWVITFLGLEIKEWAVWEGLHFKECFNITFSHQAGGIVSDAYVEFNITINSTNNVTNFTKESWFGNTTDTFKITTLNQTTNKVNVSSVINFTNGEVFTYCVGNASYNGAEGYIIMTQNKSTGKKVMDFEDGTLGSLPNSWVDGDAGIVATVTDTFAYSGTKSVNITKSVSGIHTDYYSFTASFPYTVEFYARYNSATDAAYFMVSNGNGFNPSIQMGWDQATAGNIGYYTAAYTTIAPYTDQAWDNIKLNINGLTNTTYIINGVIKKVGAANRGTPTALNTITFFDDGGSRYINRDDIFIHNGLSYGNETNISYVISAGIPAVGVGGVNISVNWTDLPYYTGSLINLTFYIVGNETKYNATYNVYNGTSLYETRTVNNILNNTLWSNKTINKVHAGEYWNVSVTANGRINSTRVLIQATAPVISTNVVINKTIVNKLTLQINCSFNYTSTDGEPVTSNYRWYKNNILINTTSLLTNKSYSKNDVLICEGWANNTLNSTLVNSSSLTVGNVVPTIDIPVIEPAMSCTNSTLNCSVRGYDIDLEALTLNFTWYNGSAYYNSSTYAATDGVLKSHLLKPDGKQATGEIWNCTVFSNDGTASSNQTSITKTIQNIAPIISLQAPINRTNTSSDTPDFIFNYTDEDGTAGNCILYVNGSNVGSNAATPSGKNTTITSTPLNDGSRQNWYVNCSDGSNTTQSETRVIGIDATTPIINIFNPSGEYFTYGLPYYNLPINFSYIESNPDTCRYGIDLFEQYIRAYSCLGNFFPGAGGHPCSNAVDYVWTTYASPAGASIVTIFENYTIPTGLKKANLSSKFTLNTYLGSWNLIYYWNYTSHNWQLLYAAPGSLVVFTTTLENAIYSDGLNNILQIKTVIDYDYCNCGYYESKLLWIGDGNEQGINGTLANCGINVTSNITNQGIHTSFILINDTFNNIGSSSSNFSINLLNSSSWVNKGNTSEGDITEFYLRINSTNITSVNATFYFNNTAYAFTNLTNTSATALFTKSLSIPALPAGNYTFYWNYTINSLNNISEKKNVTVVPFIFALCNSTYNITYLNLTFKDESFFTNQNGTIPLSTFTYSPIGNPSYSKSLTFVNASDNPSYLFCASPPFLTINVTATIHYGGTGYPTKVKSITGQVYTNTTTNLVLYMLSSAEGLYSRYTTINAANGMNIVGTTVTVQREIEGVITTIDSGVTDSSGTVTFWLNPDFTYTFSFVKTGYGTVILSLRPSSTEVYYISMTPTGAASPSINVTQGLTYNITPVGLFLNNNTAYNFSFCAFSLENGISSMSMNLTNGTSQQLVYISLVGQGCVSNLFNTSNYSSVTGKFRVIQGTEIFEVLKVWTIASFYKGSYSFIAWMGHFDDYNFGSGGATLKFLIMLIVIFSIAIGLSYIDAIDSSIAPMVGILIGVAIFSYIGWLTMPISPYAFTNQWSVFIIMLVLNITLIIWRTNTQ
jgi:hypothetical protein